MANPNSADIIAKNLADKICAQIKEKNCLFEDPTVEGVTEPVQPTKSIDGREYTNQTNMLITLLNSMFQPEYGYKYATKYKIKSLGGNLRKGQSIKPIIIEKNFMMYAEKPKEKPKIWPYADKEKQKDLKAKGIKPFWVRRTSEVFNVKGQTEHLPDKYYPAPVPQKLGDQKFIMDANHIMKKVIESNDIKISNKVCTPHVSMKKGKVISAKINIPEIQYFKSPQQYFSTLLHEVVHHTGTPDRLGFLSFKSNKRTQHYAHEELRAEIGSVYMCAQLGLPFENHIDNHAGYCKGWLNALENNPSFILDVTSDVVLTGRFLENNSPEMNVFFKACKSDFEKHLVSLCIASGKDVESMLENMADGKAKGITRLSHYHMSCVAMNYPDECGVTKEFMFSINTPEEDIKAMRQAYRESAQSVANGLVERIEKAFDEKYEEVVASEIKSDMKSQPSDSPSLSM